ncbi:MAG: NMD3-related protein [Candidatus Micrarchaeia archaeon]|jgi:nonsense-mediated mRNA decay protein 3
MKSCPQCGKPESAFKEPFIGAFCSDCFTSKTPLFEIKLPLELERCQKCGKVRLLAQWVFPNSERISEYLGAKLRSAYEFKVKGCVLEPSEKSQLQATMTIEFVLPQGNTVEKKTTRTIALLPTMCAGCSQKSGGYFEAIIQLRGDEAKIARKTELIKAMIGNDSFVSKVETLKEGIDIYVGSHRSATNVLSRLKLAYTQANKLAGKKRGKNLYRRSYCVRL